jgi:hypothetical protein
LLDIPPECRRDGSTFTEALAMRNPDLHELAQRAAIPPGVMRPVLRRRFRAVDAERTRQLLALLAAAPTGVVREALGDRWWQRLMTEIPHQAAARRRGWNAVAVEALAQSL